MVVVELTVSGTTLMARAEEDALEIAVREHTRLIYRIAYSVLRNHQEAEDATQETFLKVLRYGRKFAGVRDRKTWLARIAWRVARDRRKRVNHVGFDEVSESELVACVTAADEQVFSRQMKALLERVIAGLPVQLRDVVALSTVKEMSSADIAEVLGIPEATVRSRLFRARQMLKEKLAVLLGRHCGV